MTEIEYLKQRLTINENFVAELAQAVKGSLAAAKDIALWNGINVAVGRAGLEFSALHKHYQAQLAKDTPND